MNLTAEDFKSALDEEIKKAGKIDKNLSLFTQIDVISLRSTLNKKYLELGNRECLDLSLPFYLEFADELCECIIVYDLEQHDYTCFAVGTSDSEVIDLGEYSFECTSSEYADWTDSVSQMKLDVESPEECNKLQAELFRLHSEVKSFAYNYALSGEQIMILQRYKSLFYTFMLSSVLPKYFLYGHSFFDWMDKVIYDSMLNKDTVITNNYRPNNVKEGENIMEGKKEGKLKRLWKSFSVSKKYTENPDNSALENFVSKRRNIIFAVIALLVLFNLPSLVDTFTPDSYDDTYRMNPNYGQMSMGSSTGALKSNGLADLVDSFSTNSYKSVSESSSQADYAYDGNSGSSDISEIAAQTNAKLVKTGTVEIECDNPKEKAQEVLSLVNSYGGYVSKQTADTSTSSKYYNLTVKIPSNKFDEFLASETVKDRATMMETNVDDVTMEHSDLVNMLDAYKIEEQNLLGYLQKATSLDSMLSIEEKLRKLRSEMNQVQARKGILDNQVDYSEIRVRISNTYSGYILGTRLGRALDDFGQNFGETFEDFAVWWLNATPILTCWGLMLLILYWIYRGIKALRRKIKQRRK